MTQQNFKISLPSLDLAMVTHGKEGLKKIGNTLLPPMEGIRYVVSWQNHDNGAIPEDIKEREDVEIHRLSIPGLSNNRNNAIEHCQGDIILFADDDVKYSAEGLQKIREVYGGNPHLEFVLFRIILPGYKKYPADKSEIKLPFPKNYYVSSVEISYRREKAGDLRLYPGLGLGAPEMEAGEDEFFIISAIKRGLVVSYRNILLGTHPQESTGGKLRSKVLKGQGFVMSAIYPFSVWLRIILISYRNKKNGKITFRSYIKNLLLGALKGKKEISRLPHRYRW